MPYSSHDVVKGVSNIHLDIFDDGIFPLIADLS
jgi:hypothetical protein